MIDCPRAVAQGVSERVGSHLGFPHYNLRVILSTGSVILHTSDITYIEQIPYIKQHNDYCKA